MRTALLHLHLALHLCSFLHCVVALACFFGHFWFAFCCITWCVFSILLFSRVSSQDLIRHQHNPKENFEPDTWAKMDQNGYGEYEAKSSTYKNDQDDPTMFPTIPSNLAGARQARRNVMAHHPNKSATPGIQNTCSKHDTKQVSTQADVSYDLGSPRDSIVFPPSLWANACKCGQQLVALTYTSYTVQKHSPELAPRKAWQGRRNMKELLNPRHGQTLILTAVTRDAEYPHRKRPGSKSISSAKDFDLTFAPGQSNWGMLRLDQVGSAESLSMMTSWCDIALAILSLHVPTLCPHFFACSIILFTFCPK